PAFYDKLTGEISRSVIFAHDFYKIEETMAIDNNPVGVVDDGPSADDFVSITPPEWGADLHTLWRNENGTINTHGYMEVKKSSDFYGLGAVFNGKYDIYEVPVELNHKYGDCDSNGKINAKDLTYMKMFLLGRSENPRNNNMDCNKDGRVDVADLTQLKRAIVGGLDLGYV
ncbi:MAG: dockerin type I repeat-containing protein, partial [Eubacterium sp.]|nr:dockerin type I repeat-containing protein [Eubacterium sp.]